MSTDKNLKLFTGSTLMEVISLSETTGRNLPFILKMAVLLGSFIMLQNEYSFCNLKKLYKN